MPSNKLERKQRNDYKDACSKGYCPTSEERTNNRIKELANRLKSKSEKETLTNVLDWQNRNVVFWFERYPLSEAIWIPLLGIVATSSLYIISQPIWLWCFVFLISIFIITSLIAIYLVRSYRNLPLKQIINIFLPSMPIDAILNNKLGVCRDYAKLTACLLLDLYPQREIYFFHARSHVAIGIKAEGNLYVLDKYLPLTTIDKWHNKWNKKWYSPKKVERVNGYGLESVELNALLINENSPELDTDMIAGEMKRHLKIQVQKANSKEGLLKLLHWKKGAILYENNEVINYSLAQRLKTIIQNELIDVNKVNNLKVERKKDDLIFLVEL